MTEFESYLSQTPPREIPAQWREEILAAAKRRSPASPRVNPPIIWALLRRLLWPHPAAWAALTACWILGVMLCVSGPLGGSLSVLTPPDLAPVNVTPESYALYLQAVETLLREQQLREQRAPIDRSSL